MQRRLLTVALIVGLMWVLAFNSGEPFFSNLAYLGTGILLLSWAWSRSSLDGVTIQRFTRTTHSQIGQRVDEMFELRNQSRFPKLWLELTDHSTLPFHDSSRVIGHLQRGSQRRWQVRTQCRVRGRFRLGPLRIRSGDPLGLFVRERVVPARAWITVYPATIDLPHFAPVISDLSGDERLRLRTHIVTTNASTVRDYAPGDSQNRIHWLSSARTGRLITKEFELDPSAHIWLYLDLHRETEVALPWEWELESRDPFHPRRREARTRDPLLQPSTTEYAITAAASVLRHFIQRNRAVGLAAYGQVRASVPIGRGERQLNKILETLAVLEAAGSVPVADFILNHGIHVNRNETLIVVTADPDPRWVHGLRALRVKGIHSLAIVIDSHTFDASIDMEAVFTELTMAKLPYYRLSRDQPLDDALGGQLTEIAPST